MHNVVMLTTLHARDITWQITQVMLNIKDNVTLEVGI
jgi:hypothetical protein